MDSFLSSALEISTTTKLDFRHWIIIVVSGGTISSPWNKVQLVVSSVALPPEHHRVDFTKLLVKERPAGHLFGWASSRSPMSGRSLSSPWSKDGLGIPSVALPHGHHSACGERKTDWTSPRQCLPHYGYKTSHRPWTPLSDDSTWRNCAPLTLLCVNSFGDISMYQTDQVVKLQTLLRLFYIIRPSKSLKWRLLGDAARHDRKVIELQLTKTFQIKFNIRPKYQ